MIYKKEKIDMSLVTCPYEEQQGYISIEDDYTNSVLKLSGYSDISEDDFKSLCYYKKLVKYLPEYTFKSPNNAYHYALNVLEGRFEFGESAISTSDEYSYWYALGVIKGRFELGEPTIAVDDKLKEKYKYLTGVEL